MDFESELGKNIFSRQSEKTFIDKVLARSDVDRIRELVKTNNLSRSQLLELLSLITSNESKLLNLDPWRRYVLMKFFIWVEEFVLVAELLYDYQDDLKIWEKMTNEQSQEWKNLKENFVPKKIAANEIIKELSSKMNVCITLIFSTVLLAFFSYYSIKAGAIGAGFVSTALGYIIYSSRKRISGLAEKYGLETPQSPFSTLMNKGEDE